ncbi:MAG: translation initiation factor 2 [Lachnospiraceae bacterium]|nr:translation initiation factor 2 [Lachnospiraceae bacterium]
MKGSYRVIVSNSNVRYDFVIRRNITIIRGDSATGKTTLVEMIGEFYETGADSGINLKCDRPCRTIGGKDWKTLLSLLHETIVFIDEGNAFLHSTEFAEAVRDSDNYYVLVTREGLPNLPYSVEEIYGIRYSGKYAGLKQVFNEFYHIYGRFDHRVSVHLTRILIEDSNSGFEFFEGLSAGKDYDVVSAGGKSNIFARAWQYADTGVLIIADGAAFGSEMDRITKLLQQKPNIILYLPESFEWLILKSGVVKAEGLNDILDAPENYIESSRYFSWERFFTAFLVEATLGSHLKYSKKRLNPVYLHENTASKIVAVMDGLMDFMQ